MAESECVSKGTRDAVYAGGLAAINVVALLVLVPLRLVFCCKFSIGGRELFKASVGEDVSMSM